jgi:ribosomal protein L21E
MVEQQFIENFDSEFKYLEKVNIINGFYKGYYGVVTHYNAKTQTYSIETNIKDKKLILICKAVDLRKVKTLFGR